MGRGTSKNGDLFNRNAENTEKKRMIGRKKAQEAQRSKMDLTAERKGRREGQALKRDGHLAG